MKTLVRLIVGVALVCALGCATVSSDRAPDRGKHVIPLDDPAPWVGAMHDLPGERAYCSCVLIEPDVVVTAAHCISSSFISITFDRVEWYSVDEVVRHEGFMTFAPAFGNDIAILFLDEEVEGVDPVAVNERAVDGRDIFRSIYTAGFGGDGQKRATYPGTRLLGAIAGNDWIVWLSDHSHLQPGDSGGAVYWYENETPVLIGVNTAVIGRKEVLASIGTRIDVHLDWIAEQIDEHSR